VEHGIDKNTLFLIIFFIQLLLCCFAVVFFISGLDDLFIDCCYVVTSVTGRIFGRKKPQITKHALLEKRQQPIAIMVPAWDESDVIRPMLTNMLKTIAYENFHIFVGVYPNDSATEAEVEKVRHEWKNVHRIVCANPGPTCKADCLNWLYHGIQRFELNNGIEFQAFLMEDCEDLVHPLSLHLFNFLIPSCDMVQIPVFPLERSWRDFTSGHYIDEFCEYHGKDIFVRQRLTGCIPAAGVGCGFSRRAYSWLVEKHGGELFNTGSLTEDYEMGLEVGRLGLKSIFVSQIVEGFTAPERGWEPTGNPDRRIAVREYFPSTFRSAFRQKSRWILGIAFQGWKNLGWKGSLAFRYMLYRDRKSIVTNYIGALGYSLVLFVSGLWLYTTLAPDSYHYPPLVEKGSWLWYLLLANFFFLSNRLFWRWFCVYRVFGWKQAMLAVPRQIWSNFVNARATHRALYVYARSLILKKRIAWDKTAHVLPRHLTMASYQRKLGCLLVDKGMISISQLQEALELQKAHPALLGLLLNSLGYVSEPELLLVVCAQLGLPSCGSLQIAPVELRQCTSREQMILHSCYPIERDESGALKVAVCEIPPAAERSQLENAIGMPVRYHLTTRSQLSLALRYGIDSGDEEFGAQLLSKQAEYRRLGDILIRRHALTPSCLKEAIERFRGCSGSLFGQFLLKQGLINSNDLAAALAEQQQLLAMSNEQRASREQEAVYAAIGA
jgi:adsorption protein B